MEENDFIKITDSVYKIIDFFPDNDPLKNRTKEKVLSILENLSVVFSAKGWVSLKKEKASFMLLDDIESLKAYLKLAKYQGWIDNVNFLIISNEYDKIRAEIKLPKSSIINNLEIIPDNTKVTTENKIEALEKNKSIVSNNSFARKGNSERQKKILNILNKRKEAQVSDIIKELPNVTKRTIRRDLDDLMKKGEIERVGEWNKVFYVISKSKENVPNSDSGLNGTHILS